MEPPCEHGGVRRRALVRADDRGTSMEPPCEHGGVLQIVTELVVPKLLQWSRRVNTAEWRIDLLRVGAIVHTSMEPPCEHGGVIERDHALLMALTTSMEPPCENGGVGSRSST